MEDVVTATGQHKNAGNAAFSQKRYAEAIQAYSTALELLATRDGVQTIPTSSPQLLTTVLNNRALAFYRAGNYQECLSDALAALATDPTSNKALYRAGTASLMLGLPAQATEYLEKLDDPPADAAHIDRASNLVAHQKSIAALEETPETAAANSQVVLLREALQALWADVEGDDADADVSSCLQKLAQLLSTSATCRAVFEIDNGYRLVWFFLQNPAHCDEAAAVLKAAGGKTVTWPWDTWRRLVAIVTAGEDDKICAAALKEMRGAAESCVWVKLQLLTHPLPELGIVPLQRVLGAMETRKLGAASLKAAAELLAVFADQAGASALAALPSACTPLQTLLVAFAAAPEVCAASRSSQGATEGLKEENLDNEENKALQVLREKQRAVYDVQAVALRRHLLSIFKELCARRSLVISEAVQQRPSNSRVAKEGTSLVPATLSMINELVENSPKRMAPILGQDLRPTTFHKRPFAADWVDNPAGDFLATMNLSGEAEEKSEKEVQATPTLLELAVSAFIDVCSASPAAATICFRSGALELSQRLSGFLTPVVAAAGQRVCAEVCARCPDALEEMLHDGGVARLAGIATYAKNVAHAAAAMDKLAAQIDACSGDDFSLLIAPNKVGVLGAALEAAVGEKCEAGGVKSAGARLLRLCADRTVRCRGGGGGKVAR